VSELDLLGRTPLSAGMKRQIDLALQEIPEGKRAVLLVVATAETDQPAEMRGHVAARLDDGWKVAAGGGFKLTPEKPLAYGWFGIEKSW
jgi:hypothetical protein